MYSPTPLSVTNSETSIWRGEMQGARCEVQWRVLRRTEERAPCVEWQVEGAVRMHGWEGELMGAGGGDAMHSHMHM